MLYYFEKYELAVIALPGLNDKQESVVQFLIKQYEMDGVSKVKSVLIPKYSYDVINNLPINMRIKTKVTFIQNPLARLYNFYSLKFSKLQDEFLYLRDVNTFGEFVNFVYGQNAKGSIDQIVGGMLNSQLSILSDNTSVINYNRIVGDTVFSEDLLYLSSVFENSFGDNEIELHLKESGMRLPDDYMVNYNDNLIKAVYELYYEDFLYFKYPLHKVDIALVKYSPMTNISPVFTIITPTVGTPSLLRLKESLKHEKIPYIHLILWDTSRCEGALNPRDLEDDRTFCYEFTHPYHRFPNQRNDVWLRGVGVTLTNTPFVTFFDDDTWPDRGHLEKIYYHMINNKLEYTFCKRRMWEHDSGYNNNNIMDKYNNLRLIGTDNFESTGEITKMGYRLIDNSSLYMKLDVARKISSVFLDNQYYGDDRVTPGHLDKFKGGIYNNVLVNHVAKPQLVKFFKDNILSL
jgi:hypothetical protein